MLYEVTLEQNLKYPEKTVFKFDSAGEAMAFARTALAGEPKTTVTIVIKVVEDEDEKEDAEE